MSVVHVTQQAKVHERIDEIQKQLGERRSDLLGGGGPGTPTGGRGSETPTAASAGRRRGSIFKRGGGSELTTLHRSRSLDS